MQQTKTDRPAPPEEIAGEALLEWYRVCDELASIARLHTADRALLTLYVQAWGIWRDAMRHVAEHGAIIKHTNGVPGNNPFYNTYCEQAKLLRGYLRDMGLTPTLRGPGVQSDDAGDLDGKF